jgi:hypothetical protein
MTAPPQILPETTYLVTRRAGRDKWKRIEALGRLAEFLDTYRSAWAARREGIADVRFPSGTYLLRVVHSVPCLGFG